MSVRRQPPRTRQDPGLDGRRASTRPGPAPRIPAGEFRPVHGVGPAASASWGSRPWDQTACRALIPAHGQAMRRRPRIGAGARQDGDPLMATPADHRIGRRAPGLPRRTGRDWAGTQDRPLRVCLAAMAAFGAYTASWATAVRLRGRPLPDRPEPRDVLLTSMASPRTAGQLLWPRATRAVMGTRVAADVRRAGRQHHRQQTADHRSYVNLLLQTRAKSRLSGDLVGTWLSPLRQGDHPHHPEERQWPCASE